MFIDRLKIRLVAGKGGNGVVAWRREKYLPKGGPMGGNGGFGGSIVLRTDSAVRSLEDFRNRRILKAENGQVGGPNKKQGRRGQDLTLSIPCGTLVKDVKTGTVLYDLTEEGEEVRLCAGGRGGRGNASFRSSTHRSPNFSTEGKEGTEREIELELKLIADVGLVGFPNAGKSTFISKVAHTPVKIAPYPFTTLRPNLGTIDFDDYSRMLIADIPGIIAGAHDNRGLGLEFLRHIERTEVLLFVLDASGIDGRDPTSDFQVLRQELASHDPKLLERPFCVALNKIDTEEAAEHIKAFKEEHDLSRDTLFEISAQDGEGIEPLVSQLHLLLKGSAAT